MILNSKIKKQCHIKLSVIVKKKSLVNGTFGLVLDYDQQNDII